MKILDPSLIYVHHQELRIYNWCHVERETNNGSGWEVHGEINGKSEEIEMDRKRRGLREVGDFRTWDEWSWAKSDLGDYILCFLKAESGLVSWFGFWVWMRAETHAVKFNIAMVIINNLIFFKLWWR